MHFLRKTLGLKTRPRPQNPGPCAPGSEKRGIRAASGSADPTRHCSPSSPVSPPPREAASQRHPLEMAWRPAPSYQRRNIVTAAGPACDKKRRRRCSESRGRVRRPPARQLIPGAPGGD